jgi:uncharacterized protein YecE (DUF72 family)
MARVSAPPGRAFVGIGGWSFPPWRGTFYPDKLPQARELAYLAEHLTSTEINATFHRTQTPKSFAAWREAVPESFVFALKGPRGVSWRSVLAEAEPSLTRFLESGITELGDKLGPILWQLPPNRAFNPSMVEAFLELLPDAHQGVTLRHAIEAHHASFADPGFAALLRRRKVAWAIVDDDGFPEAADDTARFVYARLKRNAADAPDGYGAAALDAWAAKTRRWTRAGRDCFSYFIGGDKVRAPDAAQSLIRRLSQPTR